MPGSPRKRVVVIGGGFAGLSVTRALARAPVDVTLIDRRNHHLFQPLLYQVAMAGLSPAEIAAPIRSVLSKQRNVRVLLAEAARIDVPSRLVVLREAPPLPYDFLVVATGALTSYFGHDEWREFAPGLKDIEDAVEIRRRVLLAFETAEREIDPDERRRHLTFVVIGGGPTGVELAGAIAELARYVLARDFRAIKPESTHVILVERGPHILNSFDPSLAQRALRSLKEMGVDVRTGTHVTRIDTDGVFLGDEPIRAGTVLWAAGVAAAPLPKELPAPLDRTGRAEVRPDCSLPGHPEIFCIGDAAAFVPVGSESSLPGVSSVAMQQGRFVARQICLRIEGRPEETFLFKNKGQMATIGRSRAIAEIGKIKLGGFAAWLAWLLVHIYYLVDFRNRTFVIIQWAWSYLTYRRGARLITGRDTGKSNN